MFPDKREKEDPPGEVAERASLADSRKKKVDQPLCFKGRRAVGDGGFWQNEVSLFLQGLHCFLHCRCAFVICSIVKLLLQLFTPFNILSFSVFFPHIYLFLIMSLLFTTNKQDIWVMAKSKQRLHFFQLVSTKQSCFLYKPFVRAQAEDPRGFC